jgi:hypothetical protein
MAILKVMFNENRGGSRLVSVDRFCRQVSIFRRLKRTHPKVLLSFEDVLQRGLRGAAGVLGEAANGGRVQLGGPPLLLTATAQLRGPLPALSLLQLKQPERWHNHQL